MPQKGFGSPGYGCMILSRCAMRESDDAYRNSIRFRMHEVIFEADTRLGKAFDVVLIVSILVSVLVVMLDSVGGLRARFGTVFYGLEWMFTAFFTLEYLLRIYCVRRPGLYVRSFFGAIDLLGTLPTYLSLFLPGAQYLLVIRVLRVLRVFRILKLARFLGEANTIVAALRASLRKILVFIAGVLTLTVILGSMMYLVEGGEHGFTSIPRSVYWAIVTLTTVGYGDISPQTPLGQVLAAFIMICGYGIIAVPTGIVTVELSQVGKKISTQACPSCGGDGHAYDARFCKWCGANLLVDKETG